MLAQAPCSDWGEGANVPAGYRGAPAPPGAPLPKLPCQASPAESLAAPTSSQTRREPQILLQPRHGPARPRRNGTGRPVIQIASFSALEQPLIDKYTTAKRLHDSSSSLRPIVTDFVEARQENEHFPPDIWKQYMDPGCWKDIARIREHLGSPRCFLKLLPSEKHKSLSASTQKYCNAVEENITGYPGPSCPRRVAVVGIHQDGDGTLEDGGILCLVPVSESTAKWLIFLPEPPPCFCAHSSTSGIT